MARLMEDVGGDGFVFTGAVTRRYVAEITDGIVPALQKIGLAQTSYAHEHFRDNLFAY
jgi:long-chain alkane monooxygenase